MALISSAGNGLFDPRILVETGGNSILASNKGLLASYRCLGGRLGLESPVLVIFAIGPRGAGYAQMREAKMNFYSDGWYG